MNVLGITRQNSAVGYHRIMLPLHYMKREGLIDGHVRLTDQLNDEAFKGHQFDIVLVNRYVEGYDLEQLLDFRKRYGFKLVVDADDYWHLDPWHILRDVYPTQKVIDHLKAADVATCTNELLATAIQKELGVQKVHILPNALPFGEDQFIPLPGEPSDKVSIVYVGGNTHLEDVKSIAGAMKRLQSDSFFRKNATVTLCGFQDHEIWHRMAVYLKGGYPDNFRIQNGLPISQYMNLYNGADIAIAPLVQSKFNGMKSNLKMLEAAAKGIAIVTSNVEPYLSGSHQKAKNMGDWYIYLRELVRDADKRRYYAKQNQDYCHFKFDIREVNKKRAEVFKKLL